MKIYKIADNKVQVLHEEIINAPVDEVFPLACPVLEYKWIPGWKCKLVHCPNGHAELGTVFIDYMSAPLLLGRTFGKTTWTAVYFNAEEHAIHYELRNRISVSINKLEFDALGPNQTRNRMDFTYEALTDEGRALIRDHGGERIGFMQTALAPALKYYCENGRMISDLNVKKMGIHNPLISKKTKFQLLINGFALGLMKDESRKLFLQGKPISVVDPGG